MHKKNLMERKKRSGPKGRGRIVLDPFPHPLWPFCEVEIRECLNVQKVNKANREKEESTQFIERTK